MLTDVERPHRSRFGWPTQTEPTTTPAGTHSHKQSSGPLLLAFLCIVLLFAVNVGLVWFILARGEARDAAEERMRQRIHDGQCELLDAFPQAPLLDEVRRRFDCGPGLPLEDFPPEIQQELNGAPPVEVPATPPGVESSPEGFSFSDGADPNVERPEPYYPTPGVAEPPATVPYPPGFPPPDPVQPTTPPEPEPLVDLSPVTDPLCTVLPLCD